MSILSWLFRKTRYVKFDDTFALDRESLWVHLCEAIVQEAASARAVVLVVHFTDAYERLQQELEKRKLDYDVVTRMIDLRWVEDLAKPSFPKIQLLHSSLFPVIQDEQFAASETPEPEPGKANSFSVLVCDRHPLRFQNSCVERFWQFAPFNVKLGCFMALTDEVVLRAVGPTTVEVLEQLGLGRREPMVASSVVSRRMKVAEKKLAAQVPKEIPADSASEWFKLNIDKAG